MADIKPNTPLATGTLLNDAQPSVLQFVAFTPYQRHQCPHILNTERRCRDPSLALVHISLSRKHTAPNERRDQPTGLPRFFIDCGVLQNMRKGDWIESKETVVPL